MDLGALLNYVILLVPYFFIYCVLTFGLNIQFGFTGIPNFTFITFMAAGAYVTGVTALPPAQPGTYISYILGLNWPFPLSLIAGGAASGLLGFAFGAVTFRRLRYDYLAIVTFGLGFIAYDLVSTYQSVFNGFDGLVGVPQPLNDILGLDYSTYILFFGLVAGIVMLMAWYIVGRIRRAALGRTLRAIREDSELAETLGKDTYRFRMIAMVVGSIFAGIAGGLTIELISAMNPSAWSSPETFIVFAALLLGGRGNNLGAMLGAFIVPVLFFEGSRFIPIPTQYVVQFSGLRLALVGILIIAVLWFRPDGLLPERKGIIDKTRPISFGTDPR